MITSRRDYILRIIDEVSRMVARIVFKRREGADREALEIVVQGFGRLFNLEPDKLFQLTPEHHYAMLTLDEPPEIARDKVLLYAALSAEAGRIYTKLGNQPMARTTLMNALRFAVRAQAHGPDEGWPEFAPDIDELIATLGADTIDADIKVLLPGRS